MDKLAKMRARLGEIVASLDAFKGVEEFTEAQTSEINALSEEFEKLEGQIKAEEKLQAMNAAANTSTRKTATPDSTTASTPRAEVFATQKEKNGGFESVGHFLMAVKDAGMGKGVHKNFQNAAQERIGEDGGFLVPVEIQTEIQKKMSADDSLLAKCRQFPVSGNSLSLPIDETSPWSGGVTAKWLGEGGQHSQSKPSFGQASWKVHKLGAFVVATDELLEDAVALEGYIKAMAPNAIVQKINEAIISGDGVAKPTGILSSGFKVMVSKESGQTADTVVYRNIAKMYSRMLPQSRANAAWYINAAVEDQLRVLKDDAGNFIYLAPGSQANQTPYGILLGRPVIPMMGALQALGDEGDIVFADLSYYYAVVKSGGMKNSVSTHIYFDRDQTAFKFTMRVDGSVPFKTPATTQFGNFSMSGIVTLEAR